LLPPSQFGGLLELWPALSELLRVKSRYITRDDFEGAQPNLSSQTSSVGNAKRLRRVACAER